MMCLSWEEYITYYTLYINKTCLNMNFYYNCNTVETYPILNICAIESCEVELIRWTYKMVSHIFIHNILIILYYFLFYRRTKTKLSDLYTSLWKKMRTKSNAIHIPAINVILFRIHIVGIVDRARNHRSTHTWLEKRKLIKVLIQTKMLRRLGRKILDALVVSRKTKTKKIYTKKSKKFRIKCIISCIAQYDEIHVFYLIILQIFCIDGSIVSFSVGHLVSYFDTLMSWRLNVI